MYDNLRPDTASESAQNVPQTGDNDHEHDRPDAIGRHR